MGLGGREVLSNPPECVCEVSPRAAGEQVSSGTVSADPTSRPARLPARPVSEK
jgi:hypothetical protein